MKDSVYRKGWGSIPYSVMAWGLRQAGLERGVSGLLGSWVGDRIPRGQFIVLRNLEAAAKAFTDAAADRTTPFERTFSRTHFRRTFEADVLPDPKQRLSETDMDILVKFLSRDKGVLATDGQTIKIRPSTTAESASSVITEEDSAIASLKELTEDLARQTEALSRRVDELSAAAQDAVRRKNRVSAVAALRSRRQAEANLERRHAALAQLEDVAAKLQQAADNVQMVWTMRASAAALRGLNAAVGGPDRVDDVLDALREQMGEVDDVGNVIAEAGAGAGVVVDEVEVDDEFEALLAEERAKEDAEDTRRKLAELEKLGPVPAGLPGERQGKEGEEEQKQKQKEENNRPPSPATAAAEALGGLSLG